LYKGWIATDIDIGRDDGHVEGFIVKQRREGRNSIRIKIRRINNTEVRSKRWRADRGV